MDNTNIPITVSEIPPRRQSTGLSFLLRSRDQSNSEVLASSPRRRSRNNSITSTQSNTSKTFSQSILDNWLVSTSAQRPFEQDVQDTFPPWASEQAPAEPTDLLDASLQSNAALERIFEQEDELVLSDKDRSPQPHLNDEYFIIAGNCLPRDDDDEEAFRTATSTSLSPTTSSTHDPPANVADDDSQETVAYNLDDSDSQDTVPYNVDSDSQDTVPYNVDGDSQDTMPHNVDDPPDALQVQDPTYNLEAHDLSSGHEAHDILDDELGVPLLEDSNALLRENHNDSFSVSSVHFVTNPPRILSPPPLSQLPNEPLPPSIPSQSLSQLPNDFSGSLPPSLHNALEEEEEDKDEPDYPFDDITEEDMLELVRMETIVTSQASSSSSSSRQSQKRASSPIPVHLQDSFQRPEKKQLKSSLGTKQAPIDNYFFHSSSSLNSNKDLDEDIGRSTLTPSFAVSSSLEKDEKAEKAKPKPQDTRRRPRLGLSKVRSK